MHPVARLLAAVIALAAATGIALDLRTVMSGGASVTTALWVLAAYFTILTNFLAAVLFTTIALGARVFARPFALAGAAIWMALVGIVYMLLLRGLRDLTGATAVANFLMHQLTPVLVPLFWLVFARKGALTWRAPFLWALYPLAYFAYALLRGLSGWGYPYPFINVDRIGWAQTGLNAIVIAIGFILVGEVIVWLDRRIGRKE